MTPNLEVLYLDNAATSFPKPPAVYQRMQDFLHQAGANPGRSGHRMAVAAEQSIEWVRHLLAQLFRVEDPSRIVFTLNTTDALNMGLKGLLRPGDHVITSVLEHNSVSRPLQALVQAGTIEMTRLPCSARGFIDPDEVRAALTKRTRLIVLTHASNVLGTIQPVREVGKLAHEHGVLLMVDAAQTAGAVPIDVVADGIDLLAFPGHKALLGPPGTGGLYVGKDVTLRPWREGGTGGDSADPLQPEDLPYRLEGGTPNTVGIAGLGAGVEFVIETGVETIHAHEVDLRDCLVDQLRDDDRFTLHGPLDEGPVVAALSLEVAGLRADEAAAILDQAFGIAARSGLHCAPYAHRQLGTFPDGTLRLSPGFFNTRDEMQRTAEALRQIVQ